MTIYSKNILIILILVGFQVIDYSQQNLTDSYTPLICRGEIPDDFKQTYTSKYNNDLSILKEESGKSKKEIKRLEEFYLFTNYQINNIFSSGNVLFGDTLTEYVNKIASRIIKKNNINENLRFYVLKSSGVNAFATQQGVVFITVGLLAQIENESELAFIIGHEIIHAINKHGIKYYEESKNIRENYKKGRSSYLATIDRLSDYSQENELEADKEGYLLAKKAGYNCKEMMNTFKVLKYSDLPFDDIPFDENYFNSITYKIPSFKFKKEKVDGIKTVTKSSNDTKIVTHPELDIRIKEIKRLYGEDLKNDLGNVFLFNEKEFFDIQTIARFENLHLNLLDKSFVRVLYDIFLLERVYPNNLYLKKKKLESLYGVCKLKFSNNLSLITEQNFSVDDSHYIDFYNFFRFNLNKKELNFLVIKELASSSDDSFISYYRDIARDLFSGSSPSLDDIDESINNYKTSYKHLEDILIEVDKMPLSKDEKDLKKSNLRTQYFDSIKQYEWSNYYYMAFDSLIEDETFTIVMENAERYYKERTEEDKINDMSFEERSKYLKKKRRKEAVTTSSIIVMEPTYVHLQKNKQKTVLKTEAKSIVYQKLLENELTRKGIKPIVFSEYKNAEINTDEYNRQSRVKECISEVIGAKDLGMLPIGIEDKGELIGHYGTSYILFSGVLSYKTKLRDEAIAPLASSLIFFVAGAPVLIPPYLLMIAPKLRSNIHYNVIYNIQNNKFELVDELNVKGLNSKFNQQSTVRGMMKKIMKDE